MELLHISLDDATRALDNHEGTFKGLAKRGTLEIEIYKPEKVDLQSPHEKDEIYVIIAGEGAFVCGTRRTHFNAHDILFAPAGMDHRFENFSEDFICWVIFYGPEGGEKG